MIQPFRGFYLFLFILLNIKKYSRQVYQSPNLQHHVYIAAHVRLRYRFTSEQVAIL